MQFKTHILLYSLTVKEVETQIPVPVRHSTEWQAKEKDMSSQSSHLKQQYWKHKLQK